MNDSDLLILATFNLGDGPDWFAEDWMRAVHGMTLGKAGEVRYGRMDGAVLAARLQRPSLSGKAGRARSHTFQRQQDGSYILLAGQIYESVDLAQRWGISANLPTAELYAAMHARFGDECDKHIVGDYAVIQWFPDDRRVRLARSPTSRMPLHVMRDGHRLIVCSLPGPIFAAGHRATINDDMLGDWLLLNARRPEQSWYKGLHRVPAAHIEIHDCGGTHTRRYWSIVDVAPVHFNRDDDYVAAVEEQFTRGMKALLRDANSPAVLLSGGLDSQAVASFAVPLLPDGEVLRSYTAIPVPGVAAWNRTWAFGDESDHVKALWAMHPQILPTFVDGANLRFGERLQSSLLLSGWPTYNEMNGHWGHAAYELAAGAGVDVMLGGSMGNASFSYDGLTGFPSWLAGGNWLRLLRELKAYRSDARPLWRKFASLALMPHMPRTLRRVVDRKRNWISSPFETWCPMREDYARSSGALERARNDGHDFDGYDIVSSREWRDDVVTGLLGGGPEISLGFTLLYGIPMRDPTAFQPLLELCGGIGDEQYLRGGVDRWLARRLLRGRVPEMVWNERRTGMQSSDWPVRFAREREEILAELNAMKGDSHIAEVFDLSRLTRDLQDWDGQDLPERRDSAKIKSGVSRAISTARFVKFVEGRNVG